MKTNKNISNYDALKNENFFEVPDNYFDTLSENIHTKINNNSTKTIHISNVLRYAAVFLFIIIGTVSIFYFSNFDNNKVSKQADMQLYVNEYEYLAEFYDISTDDVFDYVLTQNYSTSNISEDEIITYLIENSLNYMEIIDFIE